jgi:hypothetical protein
VDRATIGSKISIEHNCVKTLAKVENWTSGDLTKDGITDSVEEVQFKLTESLRRLALSEQSTELSAVRMSKPLNE